MKAKPRPYTRDPSLDEVLSKLSRLTNKEISDRAKNLVGANTIYNWRRGKTRRPQPYTMEAALKAVGYRFGIVRK